MSLEDEVAAAHRAGLTVVLYPSKMVKLGRGQGVTKVEFQRRVPAKQALAEALRKLREWIETEES